MTETPTSPAGAAEAEPDPRPVPRRPRGFETVGDMVRSLALVLVVVAVIFLLTVRNEPDNVGTRIDFGPQLAAARDAATYDVLAPVGLPRSWKATSARGSSEGAAVTWHLGLLTPAGDYAAVEQSDGPRRTFVDGITGGSRPAGAVSIDGDTWQRLEGGEPEPRALLRTADGATTLVAGSAPWSQLRRLAAALQPG